MGESFNGEASFQLPPGLESYSYELSLHVNINDESDGITQYNIPGHIIVKPNNDFINSLSQNILDGNSSLINYLQNGSLESICFINSFADVLNRQSLNVS